MQSSPILVFHIAGGTFGLLSGAAAMIFRKGSYRHRVTGNVFVISMLSLAVSGAYLGFMKHQVLNGMMGVLTFYLVTTAWWTARRRDGEAGLFDFGALVAPLAVSATLFVYGFQATHSLTVAKGGDPATAYFIFGSVALLFAAGDIRMLVRGGIFRRTTCRAASVAHVLCPVYRHGILIPVAATSFPGFHAHIRNTFSSGYPAADIDDFLAFPSPFQNCIPGKAYYAQNGCFIHCGLSAI